MRTRSGPLLLALLLAAIVATAAAATIFALRVRGRERAGDVARGQPVAKLDPARATRVTVARGARRAELVREGGAWRPAAGSGGAGDGVPALLADVAALVRRGTLGEKGEQEDLWAYGLDAPRLRIEVTLADGEPLLLAIGTTTGTEGITFVGAPDGTVAIVSAAAATRLEAAAARVLGPGPASPASPADGVPPSPLTPGPSPR